MVKKKETKINKPAKKITKVSKVKEKEKVIQDIIWVSSNTFKGFEGLREEVKKFILEGWQPFGTVTSYVSTYKNDLVQAMVKYTEK